MPGYIRKSSDDAEGGSGEGDSYLSLVMGRGEAREQGYMMRTDRLSESTLRRVIAYTCGMVRMIDDCVAEIVGALADRGLDDDCIVAFTSDHGEFLGDHGLLHKGPPPYRQLLQVPLVIAGPGFEARAVRSLTSHLDLKRTLVEAAGVGEPAADDGISLMPLARGEVERVRDALFAEYHPRVARELYNQSIIVEDARLTIYPEVPEWGEHFRHPADPDEHCNVFDEARFEPERSELKERLRREFPPRADMPSAAIAAY
jgi:arylsulfatase A-like enzyme